MLRRRLLMAGGKYVDAHTLFFNDGTDFVDKSGNNIKIKYSGKAKINELGGESYWYLGYDNLPGMIYFKDDRLSIDIPRTNVQTIEFMIFPRASATFDRYIFNYGVDHDYFLLKVLLTGVYANVARFEMHCKNTGNDSTGLAAPDAYALNQQIHIAVETYLVSETVRRYCFYIAGKYIGYKDIPRRTDSTIENLYQYYVGTDAEAGGNYFLYDAGIKNFRISNNLRYKQKDYTPYVDN